MVIGKAKQTMCVISLAIILFFSVSIVLRIFTRQIIVKRMGCSNAFTKWVFFDFSNLNEVQDGNTASICVIDWTSRYPFEEAMIQTNHGKTSQNRLRKSMEKYEEKLNSIKTIADNYATDYLVGYDNMVNLSKIYEQLIQWNYTSYSEYNGIIKLSDGYLSSYVQKMNVSECAFSTINLAVFCKERNINFMYVQAPHKICKYDKEISGILDFSNQNADSFLSYLQSASVDTYDLRKIIHNENKTHHDLFYRTDHHWKAETGVWAARHILQILHENYGYNNDLSVLSSEKIKAINYPEWFLGSQGKKVTLKQVAPDDFSMLYPNYETSLHYVVPSKAIDVDGDFSILYDMRQINKKDYYGKSPYGAYTYADQPFERIENNLLNENRHVLMIHDSFGNCVVPFVAMCVKKVDSLDVRFFTGSVHNFIETEKPDTVILLYNPVAISETIDWSTRKHLFDFR